MFINSLSQGCYHHRGLELFFMAYKTTRDFM